MFTTLIIIGTFIKIPIPVCPFTLQFLFTNLSGLILGSRLGAIAVLIYIVLGLLGLPVFTSGGGLGYIFQPTFGYIIGFMVGTYLSGKVVETTKSYKMSLLLLASAINLIVVYLFGMIYYFAISNFYLKSNIGVFSLFIYCFVLVVPGDIVLCIISAKLAKILNPILGASKRSTMDY